MLFYPSKNNNRLNKKPFTPDVITSKAMVNPHYKVDLGYATRAICDSGAFQDDDVRKPRITPEQALNRQLAYEQRLQATHGNDWHFEALTIYDQMFGVDETINADGEKIKQRGTESSAAIAVQATIEAAEYYASQRHRIAGHLALVGQGINPQQYLGCVEAMLDVATPDDWLAFGGFCIVGKVPRLKPLLYETMELVIPVAKRVGIQRFHLLGVTVADAVTIAAGIARKHGVVLSTDSSSIEVNSVMGRVMNSTTGRWSNVYSKADKYISYHPCDLAHQNIAAYNEWAASLYEHSVQYKLPVKQLAMMV